MTKNIVEIDYTNWKGNRRLRRIQPIEIVFQETEWHPERQWLVVALDLDDHGELKKFAMKDVHSWRPII